MEKAPVQETKLEEFMSATAKSTVAVVIPLFGYWNDIPNNPVNGEVLSVVLNRVYSNVHNLILIFVAHPQSLPNEAGNPKSVANILLGRTKYGNVKNIPVGRDASYNEYVMEGMDTALHETNAQYIVVLNPWVMIQENAIDIIVDRTNRADDAKVVSGFDLRSVIEPENFDTWRNYAPSEEWDLSFNFLAMPRYVAEMITFDPSLQTHAWFERDIWQSVFNRGFGVIASQRVPIFPFDFPWRNYETKEQFDNDREAFIAKWRFDGGIRYTDARSGGKPSEGGSGAGGN